MLEALVAANEAYLAALPVTESHVEAAVRALAVLRERLDEPETTIGGVSVRRVTFAPGAGREFVVRFLFPLPAREAFRLDRNVQGKIEKENEWAAAYPGVSLLAMEQPTLGHDLGDDVFKRDLSQATKGICGVLASRAFFPDATPRHRMEKLHLVAAPDLQEMAFNLGIETFGDNTQGWADGDIPVEYLPHHAWEEWDVRQEGKQVVCDRRLPVTLVTQMTRVPLAAGATPNDPRFINAVAAATTKMRDALGPSGKPVSIAVPLVAPSRTRHLTTGPGTNGTEPR